MSSDTCPVDCPPLNDSLLVEAWVEAADDGPRDAMQALVSKWSPLESFDTFDAFDAGRTDGFDCVGYFGAVFDGRYVYFAPEKNDAMRTHAVVLRYDTHAPFGDPSSYAAYDASAAGGPGIAIGGYYGGAFDGTYVYFIPRVIDRDYYHSRLLRLDTRMEFKDPAAWDVFDVGLAQSAQGAAFDGRYLYLCPGYSGDPKTEKDHASVVIRYDTHAPFNHRASYATIDVRRFCGADAACYDGGAFDGRYVYFVPLNGGAIIRHDTRARFDAAAGWEVFDRRPLHTGWFVGAVFDGRHLYYCAYADGKVLRFDTTRDFRDVASWQVYDAAASSGVRPCGYDGGFFDGRFVYFVPFVERSQVGDDYTFHGNWLRYDTTRAFNDTGAWAAHDASRATSGLASLGYNAGAFDGRYYYAAPWRRGVWNGSHWALPAATSATAPTSGVHGVILRYDTLGAGGSFSLRYSDYGHNGGLCAATPGPSFLVNTDRGVRGVAAHHGLAPGRHHLRGVYDGPRVQLWIDGQLAAERAAYGRIVNCDRSVTLGRIENGLGEFRGTIESARVSNEVND